MVAQHLRQGGDAVTCLTLVQCTPQGGRAPHRKEDGHRAPHTNWAHDMCLPMLTVLIMYCSKIIAVNAVATIKYIKIWFERLSE